MRCTIEHRGVPIGIAELDLRAPLSGGPVEPLPAYALLQEVVRQATLSMRMLGFLGPVDDPESSRRGEAAEEAADSLRAQLNLRDSHGALIPTELIDLWDWPGSEHEVSVLVALGEAGCAS